MATPNWQDWRDLMYGLDKIEYIAYAIFFAVFIGILAFGLVVTMQLSHISKTLDARSACTECVEIKETTDAQCL